MEDSKHVPRGIFSLPNEILLSIFSLFSTRALLPITPTCQHFHSLIQRVLQQRLQIAAGLDGYTLYLECHHPSARLTASKMFCVSLGTPGLGDLLKDEDGGEGMQCVGKVKRMGELYSRFRPQRKEPDMLAPARHPAGDVPGSRTWAVSNQVPQATDGDKVTEIVTVDAQDLFSQLTTLAYLGKREPRRGLLSSMLEVCEGTIRVWRNWLSEQCETKKFTDGTPVAIHHETPDSHKTLGKGDSKVEDVAGKFYDPVKNNSVLWINTRDNSVGVKFRVKEKKWRRTVEMPILFESDVEVAVSYEVEFEEIFVRTTHLLLKLEKAQQEMTNQGGKAVVFGSFLGF